MSEEYKFPNTIELSSRPQHVRYMWVLTIANENWDVYSGFTFNGLMKAFRREGIEPEGKLPDGYHLKMVDIVDDRVVTIPPSLAIEKLLYAWRKNYYNPDWTFARR